MFSSAPKPWGRIPSHHYQLRCVKCRWIFKAYNIFTIQWSLYLCYELLGNSLNLKPLDRIVLQANSLGPHYLLSAYSTDILHIATLKINCKRSRLQVWNGALWSVMDTFIWFNLISSENPYFCGFSECWGRSSRRRRRWHHGD